jgi:hypothetical protein
VAKILCNALKLHWGQCGRLEFLGQSLMHPIVVTENQYNTESKERRRREKNIELRRGKTT